MCVGVYMHVCLSVHLTVCNVYMYMGKCICMITMNVYACVHNF